MRFLIACVALVISVACCVATTAGLNCPSGCPRILDPVCGVSSSAAESYKYFHNECLLRYENCRSETVWTPTKMSFCLQFVKSFVARPQCLRPCQFIYEPVCATDGKINEIFGNNCVFGMENCLANGKWLKTNNSACGLYS